MARPKVEYEEQEVDEIIKLKLAQIYGNESKLTYNNVWNFNKEISDNTKYIRKNGEKFKLYGYTFWASGYNGEDYYGKQRIDKIKSEDEFILAGKTFVTEMQDIFILVDKYHKRPQVLSAKLIKLFESDRMKVKNLVEQNKSSSLALKNAKDDLERFKKNFATLFYNSESTRNSLKNVISLTKSEDKVMYDVIKEMFNNDKNFLEEFEDKNSVLNINDLKEKRSVLESRMQQLEDEGV